MTTQTGSQSNIVQEGSSREAEKKVADLEFITSSIRRRGNRNKAMLIREQRERLKQKRTNAFRRCDRVNSSEVPK